MAGPWAPCVRVSASGMQTGLLCSSISNGSEIRITREGPASHSHTSEPASSLQQGWPRSVAFLACQGPTNRAISRPERTSATEPPQRWVVSRGPAVSGAVRIELSAVQTQRLLERMALFSASHGRRPLRKANGGPPKAGEACSRGACFKQYTLTV